MRVVRLEKFFIMKKTWYAFLQPVYCVCPISNHWISLYHDLSVRLFFQFPHLERNMSSLPIKDKREHLPFNDSPCLLLHFATRDKGIWKRNFGAVNDKNLAS